jgi:N-acetylglucosamine malate deacetylase 1
MILFIGAHPDDIELGCGGIASKSNGYGYIATMESFYQMTEEKNRAWKILGINPLPNTHPRILQDCTHRRIDRQYLLDELIRVRELIKPTLIFTHSSVDVHQDHKVVYEETVRAFKYSSILGYTHSWNEIYPADNRFYYSLSKADVDKKVKSLKEYESQKDRTYFKEDFIRNSAKMAGARVNRDYAESFEVIRWID